MTREEKLRSIFKLNPQFKELHVTSDDQAFSQLSDAKNHARTLKDDSIDLVTPRSFKKESSSEEKPAGSIADQSDEKAALVTEYSALAGKEPAKNIGIETLKTKIAELKAKVGEKQSGETDKAKAEKSTNDSAEQTNA